MKISQKKSLLLLTFASALIFFIIYIIGVSIFELKSYNFMVKLTTAGAKASEDIVLVVIDDKSLHQLGRWPWKRSKYTEIFEYLNNHTQTKQIGYDAIIVAPDMEHPEVDREFFNKIGTINNLSAGVGFTNAPFEKQIDVNSYEKQLLEKNNITIEDKRSKKYKMPSPYQSFSAFQKDYLKNIKYLGAVNTNLDNDGYIRKVDQIINYKGKLYPSLGLLMYSKHTGITNFTLTDKYLLGKNSRYSLKMPVTNKYGIAYSNIYFYKTNDGIYSHQKISASDVINSLEAIKKGEKPILDADIFKDKIVFVGANANAQALADVKRTPISDAFSGVDIQATNLDNIMNNEFYKSTSDTYNILSVILVFIVAFVLVCTLPIPVAILSCACLMFMYLIFSFFMFTNRVATNLVMPEVFILFAIGCAYSYRYLIEGRKKEKIQSAMGKYLSRDVMKNVVDNIDSVKLGGKRANVTVLFADIRGFTSISERLSAEEVTKILNEYFTAIVPIIEKHNGILNKFMGDAVLAVFGEPIKNERHALDAIICADCMLRKVKLLQEKWLEEGKPKIEIGVGISTGEAFVGNIGSEERLEYTVIGDTVNTASRIENYNKVYRTKFLISQETFEQVQKHVDVIKIREVSIRGKAKKINIYEVLRLLNI